jgi:uncharacterized surface protein with fasciclin (FAS1) repeats
MIAIYKRMENSDMKSSLKMLAGFVGALSLVVGLGYPTLAQSNSGSGSNPSSGRTPGLPNSPSGVDQQYNNQPNSGQYNQYNNQMNNGQMNNGQQLRSQPNIVVPNSADSESIERIVSESPSFTLFNSLLRVATLNNPELVEKLSNNDGSFTVYAPTDRAFASLPEGTIRRLVQPENRDLLEQIISYHIVAGNVSTDDDLVLGQTEGRENIAGQQNLPQQQSDRATASVVLSNDDIDNAPVLRADRSTGNMMVNNARVVGGGIRAENGTIYPIDQVIIPPSVGTELGLAPQQGTTNQAF